MEALDFSSIFPHFIALFPHFVSHGLPHFYPVLGGTLTEYFGHFGGFSGEFGGDPIIIWSRGDNVSEAHSVFQLC